MSEWAKMANVAQAGGDFAEAAQQGIPRTQEYRDAFEGLKKELEDMEKRGVKPDFPFD